MLVRQVRFNEVCLRGRVVRVAHCITLRIVVRPVGLTIDLICSCFGWRSLHPKLVAGRANLRMLQGLGALAVNLVQFLAQGFGQQAKRQTGGGVVFHTDCHQALQQAGKHGRPEGVAFRGHIIQAHCRTDQRIKFCQGLLDSRYQVLQQTLAANDLRHVVFVHQTYSIHFVTA